MREKEELNSKMPKKILEAQNIKRKIAKKCKKLKILSINMKLTKNPNFKRKTIQKIIKVQNDEKLWCFQKIQTKYRFLEKSRKKWQIRWKNEEGRKEELKKRIIEAGKVKRGGGNTESQNSG